MRYVFSRDKCVGPDMIYWVSLLVKKEQRDRTKDDKCAVRRIRAA